MEAHRRDAMASFKLRPGFSRRQYRAILHLVFINSFVLAGFCVLTIYLGFYGFKAEHYFTTTPNGKITALKYSLAPVFARPVESKQSAPPAPLSLGSTSSPPSNAQSNPAQ